MISKACNAALVQHSTQNRRFGVSVYNQTPLTLIRDQSKGLSLQSLKGLKLGKYCKVQAHTISKLGVI